MNAWKLARGAWADWTARNAILVAFALAATQLMASYDESLALSLIGAVLFPIALVAAALARRRGLMLASYLALVLNGALLQ